jgi:hypothetical protein
LRMSLSLKGGEGRQGRILGILGEGGDLLDFLRRDVDALRDDDNWLPGIGWHGFGLGYTTGRIGVLGKAKDGR